MGDRVDLRRRVAVFILEVEPRRSPISASRLERRRRSEKLADMADPHREGVAREGMENIARVLKRWRRILARWTRASIILMSAEVFLLPGERRGLIPM